MTHESDMRKLNTQSGTRVTHVITDSGKAPFS